MSNRIFKDQYSDGTTVDSNRLQHSLDEIEARTNNVPRGDISTRYVQQMAHLGSMPVVSGGAFNPNHLYPFTSIYNQSGGIVGGDTEPVVNEFRLKGTHNPYVLPPANGGNQMVWSTSIHFTTPVILRAVHGNLIVDSNFVNADLDNTEVPSAASTNSTHLIISVDSDGEKTDRHLNQYEIVKHLISDDAMRFRRSLPSAPVADMYPPHPENIDGNIITYKDIDVAIPAGGRVRFQIVIPVDLGGYNLLNPVSTFVNGLTIIWDEELLND